MKNKKGFISISIIYSFFVIFMLFLVLVMSTYVNNRFNFNVYKNDIKKRLLPEIILSNYLLTLESEEAYTSSQDGSIYKVSDQNGVRYSGKNPDNYVEFNNEEWRIIGIFDGNELGREAGKNYVKIIKSSSFNNLAWDTFGSNNWTSSSLNAILNGNYYNGTGTYGSTGIVDDQSRNMIVNANWYVSNISLNANTAYNAEDYYWAERADIDMVTTGYIGLMYPSDYSYAMYAGNENVNCDNAHPLYQLGSCRNYNWLFITSYSQWLLSPSTSNYSFLINSAGWANYFSVTSTYPTVRPTVYLDSDVKLTTGDGSKENPYIIDL